MTSLTTAIVDTAIHTRALLVSLTLRAWTGHKFDRAITDKVNRDLSISKDAGRYNRHLMKDSANLKTIGSLIGSIRLKHYANTLAWTDDGWRILTTANYAAYTDLVREWTRHLEHATDDLIGTWYDEMQKDRVRFNGEFNADDYPTIGDVRDRFGLTIAYRPLPIDDDVRVNLASDQLDAVKQSVMAGFNASIAMAVQDGWDRLADVVSKIHDRLSDPDLVFRNTLIDNARSTCEVLARLNLANDPNLDAMRERVQRELCRYDAQELRDGRVLRETTAERAAKILQSMRDNGFVPSGGRS